MSPVHKELREAQADLLGRLKSEYGIDAQRVNLRGFYHSFRMWNSRMDNEKVEGINLKVFYVIFVIINFNILLQFQEQRLVIEEMVSEGSDPPNLLLEMAKSFVGRSLYTFPILVVAFTEKISREYQG